MTMMLHPSSRRQLLRAGAKAATACAALGLPAASCRNPSPSGPLLPAGHDKPLFINLLKAYSGLEELLRERILTSAYDLCHHMLRGIRRFQPDLYHDLGLALYALEWAPLITGWGARLAELKPKAAGEFLYSWQQESGFRADISFGLRPLFLFAVYEQEEIKSQLGMDLPLVPRERLGGFGRPS